MPSLRARIVAVNGVPAEQVQRHARDRLGAARRSRPDLCRHAARGHAPRRRRLVGRRTIAGPPLVSFDADLAARLGRRHRATPSRVNVLGRDIDLPIANLRDIDWRALGINFALVASPRPAGGARRTRISPRCAPHPRRRAGAAAQSPTPCPMSPASACGTRWSTVARAARPASAVALTATGVAHPGRRRAGAGGRRRGRAAAAASATRWC